MIREVSGAKEVAVVRIEKHSASDAMNASRLGANPVDFTRVLRLAERVFDQTRQRVFNKEKVPVRQKFVSIREGQMDVIVKTPRVTEHGRKIFLAGGATSIILDCMVAELNPADFSVAVEIIDRQSEIFGRSPRLAACEHARPFSSGMTGRACDVSTAVRREVAADLGALPRN